MYDINDHVKHFNELCLCEKKSKLVAGDEQVVRFEFDHYNVFSLLQWYSLTTNYPTLVGMELRSQCHKLTWHVHNSHKYLGASE